MNNFRSLVDKNRVERPTQDELAETFFRLFGAKVEISPDETDLYFSSDDFVCRGKDGPVAFGDSEAEEEGMFLEECLRDIFTYSCDYLLEHCAKLSGGYIRMDQAKLSEAIEDVTDSLFEYQWCADGIKTEPKQADKDAWVEANKARVAKALDEALLETSRHHFPDQPDLLVNGPQKGNAIT